MIAEVRMNPKLLSYVEKHLTIIKSPSKECIFKLYIDANLITSFYNIKTFQEKIFTRSEKGKYIDILT